MIPLAEHQRAVMQVCFSDSPREQDLSLLGNPERWLLYRDLVRNGVRSMISAALPRTIVGLASEFEVSFSSWLAAQPPRTPFVRELADEYVQFHLPRWKEQLPTWQLDLLRFEITQWTLRWTHDQSIATADFDFDAIPVMNPILKLLHLGYAVHLPTDGNVLPEPTTLLVYRNSTTFEIGTRVLNPLAEAMVSRFMKGTETVAETVRILASERNLAVNAVFLESLSDMLAGFLTDSLLLGSRPTTHL